MTPDEGASAGQSAPARPLAVRLPAVLSHSAWTWALLGAAATAVMVPRLVSSQFGLLDDGLVPLVSGSSLSDAISPHFDRESGRFRPLYWLWLVAQYRVWGPNPLAFYLTLYAALVATAGLIAEAVALAAKDRLAGLLAGLAFVLAPPVIENYYTIGKAEPWLVLSLALSTYLLFSALDVADRDAAGSRRRLAGAAACLLPAYFWKETAHAMLIVSALWLAGAWLRARRQPPSRQNRLVLGYALANVACAALYGTAYAQSGTATIASGTYSTHYMPALDTMVKSALRHFGFIVRDFPLFLIAAAVWGVRSARGDAGGSPRTRALVFESAAWIAGWAAIMLPWRATLEYYLLPLSVGVAMLTGVFLAGIVGDPRAAVRPLGWGSKIALAGGLALTAVVGINSATNGRLQLTVDAANAELVEFLAAQAPPRGTVLLNLPKDSEYLFEMRQHLAHLHGRPDIDVQDLRQARDVRGALVVHPVMRQQPAPTVRLGFGEWDAPARARELARRGTDRVQRVYERLYTVPLVYVALEEIVCPLLLAADARGGVSCGVDRPVIDRRRFEYGWEVYAVERAMPARVRLALRSTRIEQGERLVVDLVAANPSARPRRTCSWECWPAARGTRAS